MRTRIILIVSAVVVLVAALLLVSNRPEPPYAGPVAADRQQLTDVEPDLVVAMTLAPRIGDRIAMERAGGAWLIREPYPFRFDWPRVQELQASFASLFAERIVVEAPQDRAQFGLDPPVVVATARLEDGSSIELHLGDPTPGGDAFYLSSRDDRAVFVVHSMHAKRFSWSVADLRDVTLAELDADAIHRIWWRASSSEVEMLTASDQPRYAHLPGTRIMRTPFTLAVDDGEFAALSRAIASIAVVDRVADNEADAVALGLEPPRAELRARDLQGELQLQVGAIDGRDAFVRPVGADAIYRVRGTQLAFLDRPAIELASRRVLAVPLIRVAAIVASARGLNLRVRLSHDRDSAGSQRITATVAGRPLSPEALQWLTEHLSEFEADARAAADERAAGTASLTVTLELRHADASALTARFMARDRALSLLDLGREPLWVVDSRKVAALDQLLREVVAGA